MYSLNNVKIEKGNRMRKRYKNSNISDIKQTAYRDFKKTGNIFELAKRLLYNQRNLEATKDRKLTREIEKRIGQKANKTIQK